MPILCSATPCWWGVYAQDDIRRVTCGGIREEIGEEKYSCGLSLVSFVIETLGWLQISTQKT